MSNKTIVGIIIVIVIILGLVFFWWKPFSQNNGEAPVPGDNANSPATVDKIVANHYWKDGEHTVEGNITLPTPCHKLVYEARVAKSLPEQVTIAFTVTPSNQICTQVLSEKFFSVRFSASQGAKISATVNGLPTALELHEEGEGNLK